MDGGSDLNIVSYKYKDYFIGWIFFQVVLSYGIDKKYSQLIQTFIIRICL